MYKKRLTALMSDFKNYGYALLAVCVFLYIGILVPDQSPVLNEAKELFRQHMLMGTVSLLLAGSLLCFMQSLKFNKLLREEAE
ncbi:YrhC family protein [Metabacillus sp. GX 13764]|uniref:YrhC family protein n=1 Tax=Metabacillus kandeliae TaxID=2900151 RepID=UPI001E481716|nr:YrhC family protein [Metabacillus kandeliae]MCD7033015.1 YrhC family protein [Metabacillus kandeliae]